MNKCLTSNAISSLPFISGNMHLEEYFKRTGFQDTVEKLDLETLKSLHKNYVLSIPFENLSLHCGEIISADLKDIYNKIVGNNRGGWCFENNFLFGWVLRKLGFDTTMLGARVYHVDDFYPSESHLINKVIIDGKAYVTDVSFGVSYQLWEPLELISGKDQPQAAGIFRLINKEGFWMLEKTCREPQVLNPDFADSSLVGRKGTKIMYGFTMAPREINDFFETIHRLQTDSTSLFTTKSICSLQTPTGFRALVGWIYCEVTYKPEEGVDVYDMRCITDDELEKILTEKLHLKLQKKLQPVNEKTKYTL